MRLLSTSALFFALASAFLLYSLNYDSRLLEATLQVKEKHAAELRSDLAVLKAERAHLARPDRIEPLARANGLKPMQQHQVTTVPDAYQPIITGSAGRE